MCCRYYMEMSPELRPYVEAATGSRLGKKMIDRLGKPLVTKGEVCPTDMVPVIAPNKEGERTVFPMIWGFNVTGLDKPVINARVETASEKKSFKEAWTGRRCVIPASWYFEWKHLKGPGGSSVTKEKYAMQPPGASITYLAGIYRLQEYRDLKYPVFTVLTREPGEELKKIHDRMPLILPESAIDEWIDPKMKAEDVIGKSVTEMVIEKV